MYTLWALKSMACQSKASKSAKSGLKLSFLINVKVEYTKSTTHLTPSTMTSAHLLVSVISAKAPRSPS